MQKLYSGRMNIYTVAIYWDKPIKTIWWMIIDETGNYPRQNTLQRCALTENANTWETQIKKIYAKLFREIALLKNRKNTKIILKYRTVRTNLPEFLVRYFIGEDSKLANALLLKFLRKHGFKKGKTYFKKTIKLKGRQLKGYKELLRAHDRMVNRGSHRLWAIALHETSYQQLYLDTLKMFTHVSKWTKKAKKQHNAYHKQLQLITRRKT